MANAWKIKALTLVISLIGILWAMNFLKKGGAVNGLKNIGIIPLNQASGADSKKSAKSVASEKTIKVTHNETSPQGEQLNWCKTRVKALTTKSGIKIEQEGTAWYSMLPSKKAIDSLAMEKWLGKHCKLEISDARPPTFVPTQDTEMLEVQFIDGEVSKFTLTPEGFYFWDGLRFRSKQFKEALEQLTKVAKGESL